MSTNANGEQITYTVLAAQMNAAHAAAKKARYERQTILKTAIEARLEARKVAQSFDPFDADPIRPPRPMQVSRREIHAAMRGATYR